MKSREVDQQISWIADLLGKSRALLAPVIKYPISRRVSDFHEFSYVVVNHVYLLQGLEKALPWKPYDLAFPGSVHSWLLQRISHLLSCPFSFRLPHISSFLIIRCTETSFFWVSLIYPQPPGHQVPDILFNNQRRHTTEALITLLLRPNPFPLLFPQSKYLFIVLKIVII